MGDMLKENRRMLVYLVVSNFMLYFGFRVWQAMFNNFAVEELGVGPASIGWIQALREIPGLMGFLLGLVALFLSEVRVMALSIILLGVGSFLTGQATSTPFLLVSTVVMSVGFHFFYPSNSAVVLMTVDKLHTPKALGQLRSLGAIAALLATGTVYLLAGRWGYRTLFTVIGGLVAIGGLLLLPFDKGKGGLPSRRRVVLRRQYWLYYALAFLMGSRRHIFTTFAIFLLVREYGISVETTATLFLINSLINTYTYQLVGKLVGRLGERVMLSIAFGTLVFVFLGYACVTSLSVLYVLFVVDNIMFGFNLATATYFQKIAVAPEEITSNLSVEQTINHIAAIVVPIAGGTVWELFGSQAPFLAGAGVVLISLVLTQFIRTPSEGVTVAAAVGGE
ncbi:MAG: MFS transporter [Anaerolineae bacterium]|nr:MAG: MFS transporter [Anaerolineae bacterium]